MLISFDSCKQRFQCRLNCVSVHEATAAFCRDPTIDGNRVLEENKVDVELLKDYQQYDLRS